MSANAGDFLVRRLKEWGVKRIYGYPGDGIDGHGPEGQIERQEQYEHAERACGEAKRLRATGHVRAPVGTLGD